MAADPADELYDRIVLAGESFWSAAHAPFMSHDITREQLANLLRLGLRRSRGSYRQLTLLFKIAKHDERRFMAFLRSYGCYIRPRELQETA